MWRGREDAKLAVVIHLKRKGTAMFVSPKAKRFCANETKRQTMAA
jgi:hypothetical protein